MNGKHLEKLIEKRKTLDRSFEKILLKLDKTQLIFLVNAYNHLDFQIAQVDLNFFFTNTYLKNL